PSLIVKAEKFVRKTFSQISPQAYTQQKQRIQDISSSTARESQDGKEVGHYRDHADEENDDDVPYEAYFPKALQHIHGWLPVPKKTDVTQFLFPHNVEFRVTDWVTETIADDLGGKDSIPEQWDVIIGFSLTKWIHLHHGDEGMKRFFQKVYRSLAPGGIFLVEPQAYSTYNRRSKILPKMRENFKAMAFMPDHFRDYLLGDEVGFREGILLGQSEGHAKNFNRDIYLYRK
ncbi:hypothetical protein BGX28_000925, partial [Mortierella sp. GBA30]